MDDYDNLSKHELKVIEEYLVEKIKDYEQELMQIKLAIKVKEFDERIKRVLNEQQRKDNLVFDNEYKRPYCH